MKYIFIFMILLAGAFKSYASVDDDWEDVYARYIDIMGDNADTSENIYDILYELYLNPININKATREDLERLPFLNSSQIEAICAYLYFYDGMESDGEMMLIEELDYYTRSLLLNFVYVGEKDKKNRPSLKNIMKYGRHDLMFTSKIPFYEREGDKKGYLGYKYRHSIRYNFKYGKYLRIGIVGAQDAGEPFFANKNNLGYDSYSYYILLRDWGKIKSLALGKYRLSFGMGLVMNNNFSLGKTANTSLAGKVSNNISAHSSSSDGKSLQGAAVTINILRNTDITGFVSYKSIDATLTKKGEISNIYTSGYHRTPVEINKKNNTKEFVTGGNILWRNKGFLAGLSGYYAWFNRPFAKNDKKSYRFYGPVGYEFYNIGANYGYNTYRFSFSGETAIDKNGAVATLNSASYKLTDNLRLNAIQRFYSYRYYSHFAQAFSDGGHIQNESGFYLGADYRIMPNLNLSVYSDIAYFPYKKYNTSKSSYSFDNLVNLLYTHKHFTFGFRHRYRNREKNLPKGGAQIHCYENYTRVDCGYYYGRNSIKLQFNGHLSQHKNKSFGWMTSCYGGIGIGKNITANGLIGYFSTKDYSSRIYIYEKGPLYSFSFPSFYGKGTRFSISARYDLGRKIMIIANYGLTKYFDRDVISSGLRKINKSYLSDIDIQLRVRI